MTVVLQRGHEALTAESQGQGEGGSHHTDGQTTLIEEFPKHRWDNAALASVHWRREPRGPKRRCGYFVYVVLFAHRDRS